MAQAFVTCHSNEKELPEGQTTNTSVWFDRCYSLHRQVARSIILVSLRLFLTTYLFIIYRGSIYHVRFVNPLSITFLSVDRVRSGEHLDRFKSPTALEYNQLEWFNLVVLFAVNSGQKGQLSELLRVIYKRLYASVFMLIVLKRSGPRANLL